MCKKVNNKHCPNTRIDKCMKPIINALKDLMHLAHLPTKIVGSCCGHYGRYPMTVVCKGVNRYYELFSNVTIPRTRKFYKKDSKGFYFIPEVSKEKR